MINYQQKELWKKFNMLVSKMLQVGITLDEILKETPLINPHLWMERKKWAEIARTLPRIDYEKENENCKIMLTLLAELNKEHEKILSLELVHKKAKEKGINFDADALRRRGDIFEPKRGFIQVL